MDKAEYEKKLLDHVVTSILEHGGKDLLSSVVLTGSFGRNEPTYEAGFDGKLQLKSDVEIALIFPKVAQKNLVEDLIRTVSAEFGEDLNLMAINETRVRKAFNFNYSLIEPKHKTIFTYDLFHGSKTIWGKDFIRKKDVPLSAVDPYEAKRLVANRIGELIYLQNHADCEQKKYLQAQWKGKLMLAMVSAWLICEKAYVSSYHGQYQRIKESSSKVESLFGEAFFATYDKVFSFLRESGTPYEVPDEQLIGYVKQIDQYFKGKGLQKPKVNSVSRKMKYMVKYAMSGGSYGVVGFEDRILQALISDYWKKSKQLNTDAEIWHKVLY